MNKIHCGDKIIIHTGKFKNMIGIVKLIKNDKVFINGINKIKKHIKANYILKKPGYILEKESYIHISNISIVNKYKKPEKIGIKTLDKKIKLRYFKSNGNVYENY